MPTLHIDTDRLAAALDAAIGAGLAGVVATVSVDGETVFAEGRGVLVPFRDPDALGAALRGLLRDPDRLAEFLEKTSKPSPKKGAR